MTVQLKEMLNDIHREAENHDWVKYMMSGEMLDEHYGAYLSQQLHIYTALENRCDAFNMFDPPLNDMRRMMPLAIDYSNYPQFKKILPSTKIYIERVAKLQENKLWPHIYVRHFGDMYGGAMIAKRLGGNHAYYDFGPNKKDMITFVRMKLNNKMFAECEQVFNDAIALFDDLDNYFKVDDV